MALDRKEITCFAPVGLTDWGLAEALAERLETRRWEEIGQFIGKVFLHMTCGGKEAVEGWLNRGLPLITDEIRSVLVDYYEEAHHGTTN
jgi:hypothetical protein